MKPVHNSGAPADRWAIMGERFEELVRKGFSGSHIAETLSKEFNQVVSRNAVIGRAYRKGISLGAFISPEAAARRAEKAEIADANLQEGRRLVAERARRLAEERAQRASVAMKEAEEEHVPEPRTNQGPFAPVADAPLTNLKGGRLVALVDIRKDQCRWIDHEPVGDCMCGLTVRPGSSYCPDHHARVWVPAPTRRARPRSDAELAADERRRHLQLQRQAAMCGQLTSA